MHRSKPQAIQTVYMLLSTLFRAFYVIYYLYKVTRRRRMRKGLFYVKGSAVILSWWKSSLYYLTDLPGQNLCILLEHLLSTRDHLFDLILPRYSKPATHTSHVKQQRFLIFFLCYLYAGQIPPYSRHQRAHYRQSAFPRCLSMLFSNKQCPRNQVHQVHQVRHDHKGIRQECGQDSLSGLPAVTAMRRRTPCRCDNHDYFVPSCIPGFFFPLNFLIWLNPTHFDPFWPILPSFYVISVETKGLFRPRADPAKMHLVLGFVWPSRSRGESAATLPFQRPCSLHEERKHRK